MSPRWIAIAVFAVAGVGVGIGRATEQNWLVAVSFGLFAVGASLYFRWLSGQRARVLDREDKTPKNGSE